MSTSGALYTSASLKAANAAPFNSMQGRLEPALLEALKDMGFDFMTPVQEQVLSKLPSMRSDCLVQAKTGTGKTIAFLLPAIQNTLLSSLAKGQVSILVMSPTRELALQIAAEAERLVSKLKPRLQVHTAFGGTAKASALEKFKRGDPKILIATPGRLNDYLSDVEVRARFRNMKTLVLDEADRMLDAGFLPDILRILNALPPKTAANAQWQGMCFSATIPPKMEKVFSHVLAKNHTALSTLDTSEPPTLAKVPQYSIVIPTAAETFSTLLSILKEEINVMEGEPRIIIFGTTAKLVALYANAFGGLLGLPVYELHSRLSQSTRTKTTAEFKKNNKGILFASDVIGRGMDFADVSLILQVGLPADADSYTHRVGRTARAGKDGRAILLLTEPESFFLNANRQFPIKPYPKADSILGNPASSEIVNSTLETVDPDVKQKAYSAYLGFMKGFLNKMRMTPEGLVTMANDFAIHGMLCDEIPQMEKKTIGKMGLKGVRGINYAPNTPAASGTQKMKRGAIESDPEPPSRRMRHQGMPGTNPRAGPEHKAVNGAKSAGRGRGGGRKANTNLEVY